VVGIGEQLRNNALLCTGAEHEEGVPPCCRSCSDATRTTSSGLWRVGDEQVVVRGAVEGIDFQDCVPPQELVAGEWRLADPVDGGDGRKKFDAAPGSRD
jgi:hypothetical protein